MNEQQRAYQNLAHVLDRIAADGVSSGNDAELQKLVREIKGLKKRLLQSEQPTQEEIAAFLATSESDDYQNSVLEVSKKLMEIKMSGKGSETLDRAFEEIANSH